MAVPSPYLTPDDDDFVHDLHALRGFAAELRRLRFDGRRFEPEAMEDAMRQVVRDAHERELSNDAIVEETARAMALDPAQLSSVEIALQSPAGPAIYARAIVADEADFMARVHAVAERKNCAVIAPAALGERLLSFGTIVYGAESPGYAPGKMRSLARKLGAEDIEITDEGFLADGFPEEGFEAVVAKFEDAFGPCDEAKVERFFDRNPPLEDGTAKADYRGAVEALAALRDVVTLEREFVDIAGLLGGAAPETRAMLKNFEAVMTLTRPRGREG